MRAEKRRVYCVYSWVLGADGLVVYMRGVARCRCSEQPGPCRVATVAVSQCVSGSRANSNGRRKIARARRVADEGLGWSADKRTEGPGRVMAKATACVHEQARRCRVSFRRRGCWGADTGTWSLLGLRARPKLAFEKTAQAQCGIAGPVIQNSPVRIELREPAARDTQCCAVDSRCAIVRHRNAALSCQRRPPLHGVLEPLAAPPSHAHPTALWTWQPGTLPHPRASQHSRGARMQPCSLAARMSNEDRHSTWRTTPAPGAMFLPSCPKSKRSSRRAQ